MRSKHRLPHALGIALVTFATSACAVAAPSEDQAAREAELTIRTLMAAWESADVAAIEELFWPDAVYDDFPNQHTYQGSQEIAGYVLALHDWADDVYFNVGQVHVTSDGAVAEWIFSAVQARPIGADVTVATGLEVVSNGVTVIQLDGDRIRRAADYMDTRPIMLQLGGRLEMPGGSVIELDGR
jgi:ketosteroid isomerase-like protein